MVDSHPYKDLVGAITALTNVVKPLGDCANNADVARMADQVKGMVNAGTSLAAMFENSEAMADTAKETADLQANLSTVINGVNSITSTLPLVSTG